MNVPLVVAEVNPHMPRSMGYSTVHLSQIHHLVPVDTPVTEYVYLTKMTGNARLSRSLPVATSSRARCPVHRALAHPRTTTDCLFRKSG